MCKKKQDDIGFISKEILSFLKNSLSEDAELGDDIHQTKEQRKRDREITKLLEKYVEVYYDKVETQRVYRNILFYGCCIIILLFSGGIAAVSIYALLGYQDGDITKLISIITICLTLLTSVLGLVTTITKYCFPENDEEYITRIVEAIQTNDLENKKENLKYEKDTDNN